MPAACRRTVATLSARAEALGAPASQAVRRVPACGRVVDASPAPREYEALAQPCAAAAPHTCRPPQRRRRRAHAWRRSERAHRAPCLAPRAARPPRPGRHATLGEQLGRQEGRLRDVELRLQRLDATRGDNGAAAAATPATAHGPRVLAAVPAGSFSEVWRGLAESQRERPQLELSRKWAAQNLAELRRAEAQLGPDAPPVVMGKWTPVEGGTT